MEKIVIIKLGALGDVVRTLPILIGLKEKYLNSEITWITKKESYSLLKSIPQISKVLTLPVKNLEEFDILYNLDTDKEATNLVDEISAKQKKGFCSQNGFLSVFNQSAEYYLNTIFDDELKKSNLKTYQEMMFEIAELPYEKQHYELKLSKKEKSYARNFLKKNKLSTDNLIGIHIGASSTWPSKKWHFENLKSFIKKAFEKKYSILLLGGPNERKDLEIVYNQLISEGVQPYIQDPNNSILELASLINLCNQIICGDTLALHISLALKKPTIGLFFCTSPNEIEHYGLLKKIISPMLKNFFPERMNEYSEELVKSISPEEVLKELE